MSPVTELLAAAPGTPIVYHRGFLAIDRDTTAPQHALTLSERAIINRTAHAMYEAARTGKVMLTQKRVGAGKFDYIATRSAR